MISKEFFLGERAEICVTIPPEHFPEGKTFPPDVWFRFVRLPGNDQFPSPCTLVYLVSGGRPIYLGKLNEFTGQVDRTPKSAFPAHSYRFRLLNRVLCRIWGGESDVLERCGFTVRHNGKCSHCGRNLIDPESVERGIGPVCWERLNRKETTDE